MTPGPPTWKIWGDKPQPLYEDVDENAAKKKFLVSYAKRDDTYLESPDGDEIMWDGITGMWVPAE